MTEKDKPAFIKLMQVTAKVFRRDIDADTIEIYRAMLIDMDIETIGRRMAEHAKNEKFFPAICEIRQDPPAEDKAQADYAMLEELISTYVYLDFPSSGRAIVEMKLQEKGRTDLMPFVDRWGAELLTTSNPTATRAQLVKQLTVEHKRGLTALQQSPDQKKVSEAVGKLLNGIGQ